MGCQAGLLSEGNILKQRIRKRIALSIRYLPRECFHGLLQERKALLAHSCRPEGEQQCRFSRRCMQMSQAIADAESTA